MAAPPGEISAAELADRSAASLVRLEVPTRAGTGFVALPSGRLVTNLHVVVGAPWVRARLPEDSRVVEIREVVATDSRRDLAVLQLPVPDVPELPGRPGGWPGREERVVALMADRRAAPQPLETRVAAVQVVEDWLTAFELAADIPEEASGGPLFTRGGELLGVATVARTELAPVTLGLPWRYVQPLLSARGGLPLSALAAPGQGRARAVPYHSLSLLEDSNAAALEVITLALVQAINAGAAMYNRGDAPTCLRIYETTARLLIRERPDCPGVQQALRQGLDQAQGLVRVEDRAWALRDAFDGLLSVVERWFRGQAALSSQAGGGPYVS